MKQEIKACQGIARFFITKLKLTKTNKLAPSHVQKKKAPMYVLTDAWVCVISTTDDGAPITSRSKENFSSLVSF